MSLPAFVLIGAGVFALLNWIAVPRARTWVHDAVADSTGMSKPRAALLISKLGSLASLEVLRSCAMILTVSASIVYLVVAMLRIAGIGTPSMLRSVVEQAQGLRGLVLAVSPAWSLFALVVGLLALMAVSARGARVHMSRLLEASKKLERERLEAARERGEWPEMEPDGPMKRVIARLLEVVALLDKLQSIEPTTQQEVDQLNALFAQGQEEGLRLEAELAELDLQRRVRVSVSPDSVAFPPPKTRTEKLKRIFMSEGMVWGLRGGSRTLFVVGIFLLIPCLLGVQSSAVAGHIEAQVVRLDDLRLAKSEAEVLEQWEAQAGESESAQDESWTEDDARVATQIADVFEASLVASRIWTPIVGNGGPSIQRMMARNRILNVSTRRLGGGQVGTHATLGQVPELGQVQANVLRQMDDPWGPPRVRTEAGEALLRDLRETARTRPSTWERIRQSARSTGQAFHRPATPSELRRLVLSRALGGAVEGVDVGADLGGVLQGLDDAVSPDAFRRAYNIKSREFLTALADGTPMDRAASMVLADDAARPVWTSVDRGRLLAAVDDGTIPNAATLAERPPALRANPEVHVQTQRAANAATRVRARAVGAGNPNAGLQYADALGSFGDFFPGQVGTDVATPRGQLRGTWNPELAAGPRATSNVGRSSARVARGASTGVRTTRAMSRARSFGRLRGFSRVGGVLIGRDPEPGGEAPDVVGLEWSKDGREIEISVHTRDGTRHSLGTFRASVASQALAYAADGRPITVTMVSADPLAELRILLHPALLDSPLGCRAIEIDRFVDIFTGGSTQDDIDARQEATMVVSAHSRLYALAWAVRVSVLTGAGLSEILGEVGLDSEDALGLAALALDDASAIADPARSPLTAKPEFYDPRLVEGMVSCAQPGADLVDFRDCVQSHTRSNRDLYEDDESWSAPPPTFQVWSGVREQAFRLDPDFSFLAPGGENGAASDLWPFDFMIQVAFTSPPEFVDQEAIVEGEFEDEQPWEFPVIADWVEDRVSEGIRVTPEHSSVVRDLGEFTVLQRFFRMGLTGQLGEAFPLDDLVAFMEAVSDPPPPEVRTFRWNPRPGSIEYDHVGLVASLTEQLDSFEGEAWAGRLRREAERCQSLIENSSDAAGIPTALWERTCSFSDWLDQADDHPRAARDVLQLGVTYGEYSTQRREMRRALGVHVDDAQSLRQRGSFCQVVN